MSVQKGPQGMGQRDPSCLESEAAMWWSGIGPKDSQGWEQGFLGATGRNRGRSGRGFTEPQDGAVPGDLCCVWSQGPLSLTYPKP